MDRSQPVFIAEFDLAPADVLFCAGDDSKPAWRGISYGSSGDYVHTAVYVGDGFVVEACKKGGVARVELAELVARYPYIAATRCHGAKPGGLPDLSKKVVEFCLRHVDVTPYNLKGALRAPFHELRELRHQNRTKRPYITPVQTEPKISLFCSELVVEAFIYGGYILEGTMNASGCSPSALAEDCIFGLVGYFGSPDKSKHIRDFDHFLTGGIPSGRFSSTTSG